MSKNAIATVASQPDLRYKVGDAILGLVLQVPASLAFLQSAARTLGVKVTRHIISKSASRFVPLIGAVGVGAYAYFDTTQVAKTAIELFSKDIEIIQTASATPPTRRDTA